MLTHAVRAVASASRDDRRAPYEKIDAMMALPVRHRRHLTDLARLPVGTVPKIVSRGGKK